MSGITYHLVAAEYFRNAGRDAPYTPAGFEADGFIHCTDGIANIVDVGNRYHRDDRRMYVVLVIDTSRVSAPVTYEGAERIYPHIHGPLNRDAIVRVLPILRNADGTFRPLKDPRQEGFQPGT